MNLTNKQKRLARMAGQIHAKLSDKPLPVIDWELPLQSWRSCDDYLRQLQQARQRSFDATLSTRQTEFCESLRWLIEDLQQVYAKAQQLRRAKLESNPHEIYQDLVALKEEFSGTLAWKRREACLSVATDAIDLEGRYLGPFRIDLMLNSLDRPQPFNVVALNPHPASKDDSVTHPHVQGDQLCEGDGKTAIRAALHTGRLLDFFQLVSNVLHTYNDSGPYVALEDWDGAPCIDCDCTLNQDYYTCSQCSGSVCSDCERCCTKCSESLCAQCNAGCGVCEESLCRDCSVRCEECNRRCCPSCIQDDERCQKCHDEDEQEQESEQESESAGAAL